MQNIGRYAVQQELGRGAMGIVYRALDPSIGRTLAIKTIRLSEFTDTEERARLRDRLFREAQSAGGLSHPGIVTIYDIAEQDNIAYIAMEYVDGPTLDRLLQSAAPDRELVVEILRQTAASLDYAHSRGVVHRDIKPANIIIQGRTHVKITDFGVAKLVSAQATQSGTIMGTPNYMSPEQIQGKSVDGRTDQFSLAVIAYELLTGERPFVGDSLATLVFKIVRDDPVAPQRVNPSLGWPVDTVLKRALAKNPEDRYPSCVQFAKALENACNASKNWQPMSPGGSQTMPTVVERMPLLRDPDVTPAAPRQLEEPAQPHAQPPVVASPAPARPAPTAAPPAVPVEPALPVEVPATLPVQAAAAAAPPPSIPDPDPVPFPDPPLRPVYDEAQVDDEPPRALRIARSAAVVVLVGAALGWAVSYWLQSRAGAGEDVAVARSEVQDQTQSPPSNIPGRAVFPPGAEKPNLPGEPPDAGKVSQQRSEQQRPSVPMRPSDMPAVGGPTRVQSQPSGAIIEFDSRPDLKCTTPCEMPLPPGRHTLAAYAEGHRRALRIFELPQERELLIQLEPSVGTVMIRSEPDGASIVVNGQPRPEKTPASIQLPAGKHVIEIIKEGFKTDTESVTVKDSAITNIGVDWTQPGAEK